MIPQTPQRIRLALPQARGPRRRTVVFRGDLRSTMGYGYETRALARLLPPECDVFGVDLHYNNQDASEVFPGELITDGDVSRLCATTDRRVIVVNNTSPEGYVYFPGAVNIGTFYWETDAIAYQLDWPEMIAAMDFSWAKSTHHQNLLRRCGVWRPIPLVTWPFDFSVTHAPSPGGLTQVSLTYVERLDQGAAGVSTTAAEITRFGAPLMLSVSSMAPRKGLPILLSEWRDYVAEGGRGVLLLKLRPIHNHRLRGDATPAIAELLVEAGFRAGDPVRIAYTFEDVGASQLRDLYQLSDGYVTATYGEGFGGPVVEALILGRPVIAPRHSSLADLLPPDYSLEVECRYLHVGLAGNPSIYPHASSWGLPVRGSLVRLLRSFEAMSQETRQRAMEQARRHAESFCSKAAVGAAVRRFLDGLNGADACG